MEAIVLDSEISGERLRVRILHNSGEKQVFETVEVASSRTVRHTKADSVPFIPRTNDIVDYNPKEKTMELNQKETDAFEHLIAYHSYE